MVGGILTPLAGSAVALALRGEKRIGCDETSRDQTGSDSLDNEAGGKRLSAGGRIGAAA
jgi:hypothetical protein